MPGLSLDKEQPYIVQLAPGFTKFYLQKMEENEIVINH